MNTAHRPTVTAITPPPIQPRISRFRFWRRKAQSWFMRRSPSCGSTCTPGCLGTSCALVGDWFNGLTLKGRGFHGGWRGAGIAAGVGAGLALGAAAAYRGYGYGYPSGYGGGYGYRRDRCFNSSAYC
jgi:hypothetical protein